MDIAKLGLDLAKLGAPILATVLGGPAGTLTTAVIGALAEALGTDPTPEAVAKGIQTNPKAAEIVRAVEQNNGQDLLAEILKDRQDARATTIKLVEQGSAIAWGAPVISVLVVLGFIGMVTALLFRTVPDNQVSLILFGTLSTAFGSVISYWLGSSAGSAKKDTLLADIAKQR